jgi:hypothetical protein
MKIDISKKLDKKILDYELDTCDINDPKYLIMHEETFSDFIIFLSHSICGIHFYRNIPIAICNALEYGEIDVI